MGGPKRQYDLFAGAPPRSHHAAQLNSDAAINNVVKQTLVRFGQNGGSAEEIADATRLRVTQVSAALTELVYCGEARRTEMKHRSRSNGWGTVYLSIENKKGLS